MSNKEKTIKTFFSGLNCAQSVLSTFSEELGLDKETSYKISSSFGSGYARLGETCGAVSGALMVLGLKYGYTDKTINEKKALVFSKTQEFINKFKEKNKTISCGELLELDINTEGGMKKANEKQLFTTLCRKVVEDAVEILEEMI